jgi:pyruvate/2-oxoglutarate dehydrogenase complex dihydrolipoamide acyltransferase (E2) component
VLCHVTDAASRIPAAKSPGNTRIPLTAMRRRVAEHIARSLVEAPHVTTLFEADLTRVLAHRERHAADCESPGRAPDAEHLFH